MQLAKLYGPRGLDVPYDELEWEVRWVALAADGTLWHADDAPSAETGGVPYGLVGRVEMSAIAWCEMSSGRDDELCLAQSDKCHLLRLAPDARTELSAWRDAIARWL